MKKIATSILVAIMAVTLALPAAFAIDKPVDDKKNPGKDMPNFGRIAVFDSIKKENDWVSTMKVTFMPESSTTDVMLISGLTEYKNIVIGSQPTNLDPNSLKKGDYIFVNSIFGSPIEDGKVGKQFARLVSRSDLKGTIMGIRARDTLGTVEKIDGKTMSVMPYGPRPSDKKVEALTINLYDNMIVFKADEKMENVTQLKASDIKTGSKIAVSVMPLGDKSDDASNNVQMYAVLVKILDSFPEMRTEQLAATVISSENNTLTVTPVRIDNKNDPRPGQGNDNGGNDPRPGNKDNGNNIGANDDTQPPEQKTEKTVTVKYDSSTIFVLNTGSKIETIKPADIREKDKLVMTVQMRETNNEWALYAKTVRVMQNFPNPGTNREVKVFGTLESFGQYSITFKPNKVDASSTLAMDPECVFVKQAEEGKRPEIIKQSDIKAGDKLVVSAIVDRKNNGKPNDGQTKPNEDKPQPKIEGTVFMVMVIDAFPNPVAMGKITEISASKVIIQVPTAPNKDNTDEKKTLEFTINANTKYYTMTREGKKEVKIDEFKADQWIRVEYQEANNANTAISIMKIERPQNPNPQDDGQNPPPEGEPRP
ncbi:MAG: hypothetical protein KA140_00415 [Caldisericia bacterium]|nr:hypothetical protein [Caldisericia bacterium]